MLVAEFVSVTLPFDKLDDHFLPPFLIALVDQKLYSVRKIVGRADRTTRRSDHSFVETTGIDRKTVSHALQCSPARRDDPGPIPSFLIDSLDLGRVEYSAPRESCTPDTTLDTDKFVGQPLSRC